jgi:hypothetical protein
MTPEPFQAVTIIVAPRQPGAAVTVTAVELHDNRVVIDVVADRGAAEQIWKSIEPGQSGFELRDDLDTPYTIKGSEGGGDDSVHRMAITCLPAVPADASELLIMTAVGEVSIEL